MGPLDQVPDKKRYPSMDSIRALTFACISGPFPLYTHIESSVPGKTEQ